MALNAGLSSSTPQELWRAQPGTVNHYNTFSPTLLFVKLFHTARKLKVGRRCSHRVSSSLSLVRKLQRSSNRAAETGRARKLPSAL